MGFVLLEKGRHGEAHVMRLALERADIAVELRGEDRAGLFGVEPHEDTLIELWVEESQLKRAQQVLEEFRRPVADGPERNCAQCGAPNPAHFQVCWQCQALVTDGTQAEVVEAPGAETPARSASPPSKLTVVLAVAVVGLTIGLLYATRVPRYIEPPGIRFSEDEAGCLIERDLGIKRSRYCDDDGDGAFDRHEFFDSQERLVTRGYDKNENGAGERVDLYDPAGVLEQQSFDHDDDGRIDEHTHFLPGGVAYRTVYPPDYPPRLEVSIDGGLTGRFRMGTSGWVPSP